MRFSVVKISLLKAVPSLFLSFIKAFNARSLKSYSPLLTSPEGVNKKTKYLYDRTLSRTTPLMLKFPLINLTPFIKYHTLSFICVNF